MSFLSVLGDIGGIIGAPFTGGASLALTGLGLGSDVLSMIQGNNAQSRALGQQLSGIEGATGDINTAQTGAENVLTQGRDAATYAGDVGLGGIFGQTQPYTTSGSNAAYALSNYQSPNIPLGSTSFNFDPSKVTADPGTQFIMDQAAQTLSRSAAGRGALNSGGTQKDIADYLTQLGSTLYGQAYNRQFQTAAERYGTENQQNLQQYQAGQENAGNQFNRLYALSNQGLSAANQNVSQISQFYQRFMGLDEATANELASTRLATGGNLANLSLGAGNARAAATLGKANTTIGGIQNIGYDLSSFLRNQKPDSSNNGRVSLFNLGY